MTAINHAPRLRPGVAQQWSTRAAFIIAGFAVSSWAPLVPYVKSRLDLDEAGLGLLLLCLGLGSILTMPFTGMLTARLGCRIVITVASFIVCLTLPLLGFISSKPLFAAALFCFGAGVGTVDVAVNIQAVMVEKASGRAMMSGFHGMYSAGGIFGAAGVSALLSLGWTPLAATLVSASLILLILAVSRHALLPYGGESHEPPFSLPRGQVIFIGFLCFIMFQAEGAMLDWSALLLTEVHKMNSAAAGFGYSAFAIAMTAGRLCGDRLLSTISGYKIVLFGGLSSAAGLILSVTVPSAVTALFGFVLVGLGAANIVPVLFSAAGRQTAMPVNHAIAAITTLGYAGILIGPAFIGFIAHATSLSVALSTIAAALCFTAFAGSRMVREK